MPLEPVVGVASAEPASLAPSAPPAVIPAKEIQEVDMAAQLSDLANLSTLSTLRHLVVTAPRTAINLAGGLPPPAAFPMTAVTLTLADGSETTVSEPFVAQQYHTHAIGLPTLTDKLRALTARLQRPFGGMERYGSAMVSGATHGMDLITEMLLNPGESLIVEEYHFPVIREVLATGRGYHVFAAAVDEHGLVPEKLDQLLDQLARTCEPNRVGGGRAGSSGGSTRGGPGEVAESAATAAAAAAAAASASTASVSSSPAPVPSSTPARMPFPRLLYTVPHGQNPTGSVISMERKRAVYRVAQKHNLIILEDDPYFLLRWGIEETTGDAPMATESEGEGEAISDASSPADASLRLVTPGSRSLEPGYLSIDTDMRVVRLDTTSKFLAPGLRIGWVTAHPLLADKISSASAGATGGTSTLTSAVVDAILGHWGDDGLEDHVKRLQTVYGTKALKALASARKHLEGLAVVPTPPTAGMFLWIKCTCIADSMKAREAMNREDVILVPAKLLHVDANDQAFVSPYVRASFSFCSPEAFDEGMRRFAIALRETAEQEAKQQQQ